jgi:putative alpha-1,2-mannosidase
MSAWYVLASIGLYQVTPGLSVWELSTPMFDTVHVRNVTDLHAAGASPTAEYVAAARLGHRDLDRAWVSTGELFSGRGVDYQLSPSPTTWATASTPPVVG